MAKKQSEQTEIPTGAEPKAEAPAPAKRPDVRAADVGSAVKSDAKRMEERLSAQPKIRMFVPLGFGEKPGKGNAESVTINGFRMEFEKGKWHDVPEQAAQILMEHLNMSPENTEIGRKFDLANPRTQEGVSTDEALQG